jgi:putative transposase
MRLLTIVDEFTRENLEIAVACSMPAKAVIEVLSGLFAERCMPAYLRSVNGPEFLAAAVKVGVKGADPLHRPGIPWQNAYGESLNDKFRDECLKLGWFNSLAEASVITRRWRKYYNEERPHSSLGYRPPV